MIKNDQFCPSKFFKQAKNFHTASQANSIKRDLTKIAIYFNWCHAEAPTCLTTRRQAPTPQHLGAWATQARTIAKMYRGGSSDCLLTIL